MVGNWGRFAPEYTGRGLGKQALKQLKKKQKETTSLPYWPKYLQKTNKASTFMGRMASRIVAPSKM